MKSKYIKRNSVYQTSPLAYNPSYGLSSSYYSLISSYRPYSYNGSAFLPLPNMSAFSSRNRKISFSQIFEYLTSYLEDSGNYAAMEAGLASSASVLRIIFEEMPKAQGLIELGEEVIDPLINRIANDNLRNKQLSMPAYAYVIEILDAKEAIPVFFQLVEEWKSAQDPFIPYFLVRTLDTLLSDEETETFYKYYMESEFIESVIEKAKDYL